MIESEMGSMELMMCLVSRMVHLRFGGCMWGKLRERWAGKWRG